MGTRCKVFISYSHKDEIRGCSQVEPGSGYPKVFYSRLKAAIAAHRDLLTSEEIFFDDARLGTEPVWRPAIEKALDECWLLIFLVSPDSILSDFCMTKEIPRALLRGARVVTVVLRPSPDWHGIEVSDPASGRVLGELGEFHTGGLPKAGGNTKAVSDWGSEDDAWAKTCEGILAFLRGDGFGPPVDVRHDPVHVDTANARSHEASPEPRPEWPQEEAAFLNDCSDGLESCFSDHLLRRCLSCLFDHPNDLLPAVLRDALNGRSEDVGKSVCVALMKLVDDLTVRLSERSLVLSQRESVVVRERLKKAMGVGARMCLNPNVLEALWLVRPLEAPVCRRLPATEIAGATLAMRKEPSKTWKRGSITEARLGDSCAISVPIELGDKRSTEKRLIELAYAHRYPGKEIPSDMDDTAIDRMRGDLSADVHRGLVRYFVLPPEHDPLLTSAQENWVLNQLSTGLLVLKSGHFILPLFRFDERTLLSLINNVLTELDRPEWNPS